MSYAGLGVPGEVLHDLVLAAGLLDVVVEHSHARRGLEVPRQLGVAVKRQGASRVGNDDEFLAGELFLELSEAFLCGEGDKIRLGMRIGRLARLCGRLPGTEGVFDLCRDKQSSRPCRARWHGYSPGVRLSRMPSREGRGGPQRWARWHVVGTGTAWQ